ncbi:class I SAM-dependent methyltransferase [Salinirubellus salinus]|uniref:Class I SAM-dependent methyltransferase n=1 Tax=Salinirubellus salinus TaxID=1364945 RepID=A0A9E7R535_9EURY|nr:class I SAM-dependent methyltransferase [Salinirubellus salinus]UWM56045.1 class I SAM-dependent methyltransferase [Salinirubellus salinus]
MAEDGSDGVIPSVDDGYDELASAAVEDLPLSVSPWGDSHFQSYYSWPGLRECLPDVHDTDVLIAGCGRGDHVEFYRQRGATVTGLDVSAEAIERARDRHPDGQFEVGDISEGLPFEDDAFHVVVANLVLSHIAEWRPVFESFRRVLRGDGSLAVATIHPAYQREHWNIERYANRIEKVADWGVAELPSYYRPMSAIVRPFLETGFTLDEFSEPTPMEAYEDVNPERYTAALRTPQALVVRASPRVR